MFIFTAKLLPVSAPTLYACFYFFNWQVFDAANCLKKFKFLKIYDIYGLGKNFVFPLNSQNFHIHSKVTV